MNDLGSRTQYQDYESSPANAILSRLDSDKISTLSSEEKSLVLKILEELSQDGRSLTLDNLWSIDYKEQPVSPEIFFTDNHYLGHIGRGLYDKNMETLVDILDPSKDIFEVVLTGSIGYGKTTLAVCMNIYKLYRLLCLHNPAEYYGLAAGSLLVTMVFGIDLARANLSLWSK